MGRRSAFPGSGDIGRRGAVAEVPPGVPPEIPPPWRPSPGPPPVPPPSPPWPVPTVPVPDSPASEGGLADRLLARRIVLVGGTLDARAATDAAARLMLLDGSGDDPVELHLSCPDGDLDPALSLADTVDLVGVEVRAVASGRVGGPPLAAFAAAHYRVARSHTVFVLRDPEVQLSGRADDVAALVAAHQRQLDAFHGRLAAATRRPLEQVEADLARGRVLDAREAVDYRLADEVSGG